MKYCPQCGDSIANDATEGLCARCLLGAALNEDAPTSANSAETRPAVVAGRGAPAAAVIDIGDVAEVARRLPQFEILQLLGRGGMGVVYKARQIELDRAVALKILPPADAATPGFVERFRREARSLAKLSHPNIVHLYESGEAGGLYFFVMEFVDGANLRQAILSHGLTPAGALAVVPRICDALQYAHEEGVVHRDIKPENILIDKKGRVKIADFGLAKVLGRAEVDPRLTVSGATLGTPRYMAPEQVEKPESVDHRADIYSLGVVFYEMLTGEVPMGRFAPPSQKVRIDVRLDEIVLHALERDVELRYQHASQVGEDVERVTSTGAVEGRVPVVDYAPAPASRAAGVRAALVDLFVREPERWGLIGTSVALYAVSLFLPAVSFEDGPSRMSGASCFNWVLWSGHTIWLANPVLWAGWLLMCFRRPRLAAIAGGIAFALCMWVMIDHGVVTPKISWNGRPASPMIPHLLSGYACWTASAGLFAIGASVLSSRGSPADRSRRVVTENVSEARSARVSRLAVAGLLVPLLILVIVSSVFILELSRADAGKGNIHLTAGLDLFLGVPAAGLAMLSLGALAVGQIKRSNGKLLGLRLAAGQVILIPLILLFLLVGEAIFWGGLGLLMLVAPHDVPFPDKEPPKMSVVIPLLLVAIPAALAASFSAGRAAWRVIVGPSRPQKAVPVLTANPD